MGLFGDIVGSIAGSILGGDSDDARKPGGLAAPNFAKLDPKNFLGVSAGGLSTSLKNGVIDIGQTVLRNQQVGGISQVLGQQGEQLARRMGELTPGFGKITQTRLAQIENERRRSIGDLRENLGRRRMGGSSFANDAIARAEAEFAQAKAEAAAQSWLEEFQLSTELEARRNDSLIKMWGVWLQDLNYQAEWGLKAGALGSESMLDMAKLAQSNINALAETNQMLLEQEYQGRGELGNIIGKVADAGLSMFMGGM